jgi:hypothetical protein
MALPKITHPLFKLTIPSTKKVVNFRPYTVREEKLLLMMKTTKDLAEISEVIKQIINNCSVDKIDVDKLSLFDIEYIFIKLRANSVSEEIELIYTKEKERYNFFINLNEVEIKYNPEHQQKFILHDNIGVSMNYPTFTDMLNLEKEAEEGPDVEQMIYDTFIKCIDSIYDDTKVYKDFTKDEINEFVLSLPKNCIEKIKDFFDTIPVLEHQTKIKLKSGETEDVTLKGLKDFFIF